MPLDKRISLERLPRIVIVDWDSQMQLDLGKLFDEVGVKVESFAGHDAYSERCACTQLGAHKADLILFRLDPPPTAADAENWHPAKNLTNSLARTCRLSNEPIAVPLVGYSTAGDVPTAVGCLRAGAMDFIDFAKPDTAFRHRVLNCLPTCQHPIPPTDAATPPRQPRSLYELKLAPIVSQATRSD